MWIFELEDEKTIEIASDLNAAEMSEELMQQPAHGYVYDEDSIIAVRRVICARRVETT